MVGAGFFLDQAKAGERTARDRLTFEAWGARLTRTQYLDRERLLRQTSHGQHNMHSWVLRLTSGVVVASCETFRLPLRPHGAIEVIASVYVERALRGVKMASRMMEALVIARREAGIDGLLLFSEVGPDIYARAGFRVLPAPFRAWESKRVPLPTDMQWLTRAELPQAIEHRERLRGNNFDVRLTEAVFDWHIERSSFYAQVFNRPMSPHVGVRAGDVQLLWAPDFKHNVLRILDATGPAGESILPAVHAAQIEGLEESLAAVELWDDNFSVQLSGGILREREDDIPMGQAFTPLGELFFGAVSRACWA